MVARIDLIVHARDFALLINKITHALGPLRFRIVARAVRDRDTAIGVTEQRERKGVLLCERGIRLDVIEAGAENLDIVFVVVTLMVAEPATFGRSSRSIGGRIEPQQHLSSAESRQRNRAAIVRRQRKIGCPVSCLNHRVTPPQFSIARSRASICMLAWSLGSISIARSNSATAAVSIPLAAYRRPRFRYGKCRGS